MENIRNVVEVMNFHSLLRIDKSKRKADNYKSLEEEITTFMSQILNNKNLNLDAKLLTANKNGIVITFYIANDLGFCGNFNSAVKYLAKKDTTSKKIMIGEKIFLEDKNVILNISKEDFYKSFDAIEEILKPYLQEKKIKEINVVYNRYITISEIKLMTAKIFPLEVKETEISNQDFIIESDLNMLFEDLILFYIGCKLQIIECNSWAAENIMRQNITDQSLKKIDELEEEHQKQERKERKYKAFKKQIANYRRKGNNK